MAKKNRGDQTQEHVFKREPGKNLPDLVSKLISSGTIPTLLQFVANSFDADATQVHIQYRSEERLLSITDDGEGMGLPELSAFYRLGDSLKVVKPISPKGRERIGKFGVATMGLSTLAGSYTLETWRDGTKILVEESLDGVIDSDKEIIARSVSLGDSQSHGTMITMRDLKFTSGDSFSLEKLKDKIKWGLTLSPVFRIYINGEEVKPKFIEDSIKFKVDKTGDEMGHLEGIVHLTPKSSENYGLYVYVKKCLVGDPRALLSEFSPKVGLEKRIIGIVNVDLNHAVLFDRSRFKEDDPGVMEMKKALGDVLRNVRNYADGEAHRKAVIDYRKNIGRRVEKVLELFMSRNILPDDTQVEIQSLEEPSLPGIYDPEGRKITLNQNHPLISVREEVVASTQALNIINIFVETIALHRAKFMDSSLDIFLSEKADLLRQLNGASSKRYEQITIFPDVLYDLNGLARQTGMSIGLVREMVEGNVLPSDEDGVLGRDFLEFKNRTKGLSSLYEAISSRFPQSLSTQMIRYVEILNRIGNVAEPFVILFNIST